MTKKGKSKNTKNKAKHAKLMAQKRNKLEKTKTVHKEKLKSLIQKIQEKERNKSNI